MWPGSRVGGVVLAALALAASVCGGCRTKKGVVVVGVQSERMGGAISRLHVLVKVGGVVVHDETLRPPERAPLAFPRPWELRLSAGHGEGEVVDVEVDGFDAVKVAPILTRLASTQLVPDRELLLRIQLESRCIVYPIPPRAPGSPPAPLTGPTCDAPETCIRGACQASVVPASRLEPYVASWATHTPDLCVATDGGTPSVSVGTGQVRYSALSPGQVLQAEPGPQGGHHIWIALRTENMRQVGSITTLSGLQPGTGAAIPPATFAFPFDPDVGRSCQLDGLRYQLDNEGVDYTQFLGKPLDVTATVVDSTGAKASSRARIQVAPDLAQAPETRRIPAPGP